VAGLVTAHPPATDQRSLSPPRPAAR
jgi:hypothetical protein